MHNTRGHGSLDLESNPPASFEMYGSKTRITTGPSNGAGDTQGSSSSSSSENISPTTLVGHEKTSNSEHPPMPFPEAPPTDSSAVPGPTDPEVGRKPNLQFRHGTTGHDQEPTQTGGLRRRSTSQGTASLLRRVSTTAESLFTPSRPVGPTPTVAHSIKAIVTSSWLNLMLVFIPVSWVLHFIKVSDTVIFVFSFLAIIPLAKLLGFATEELALRVGQTIGGLLNATLGNAVELIISIIALTKCQLRVVQSSLIGSILSNLLLVLGMCFFAGGTRFSEQGFMIGASQVNSSLLTAAVISVVIPSIFHAALNTGTESVDDRAREGTKILQMSRGVSVILLYIYGTMLAFQLWSHAHLYDDNSGNTDAPKSIRYPAKPPKQVVEGLSLKGRFKGMVGRSNDVQGQELRRVGSPQEGVVSSEEADTVPPLQAQRTESTAADLQTEEGEGEETPQLSVTMAVALLVVVTVLTAFTAEFLVDSIDGLVEHSPLSEEWVGLVLIPIVGNAAEHVTAVTVSVKDKLDLSIGVAVGSSIQISLLVIPLIVLLGWAIGKPLTLLFDPFEAATLFLAVLVVNNVVADGKSNWLEGNVLMSVYVLIAVALWFYPGSDPAAQLLTCVR